MITNEGIYSQILVRPLTTKALKPITKNRNIMSMIVGNCSSVTI